MTICVDPGHPPLGTTGPHGIPEHAVNWMLSKRLEEVLTARGARVVLTRQDQETVALPDRVSRAIAADADLFVSIHTNAVGVSDNPFERTGFSVYYYQPQSLPLAESVHAALREQVLLHDDGMHFGNLHVIRQSVMPAILVECAYLIWPPEEEFLLDPDFQTMCATAIASGIETFLKNRRSGF